MRKIPSSRGHREAPAGRSGKPLVLPDVPAVPWQVPFSRKAELRQLDECTRTAVRVCCITRGGCPSTNIRILTGRSGSNFRPKPGRHTEVRKSDVFCFAALHATGPERERFIERADFFFGNGVNAGVDVHPHAPSGHRAAVIGPAASVADGASGRCRSPAGGGSA